MTHSPTPDARAALKECIRAIRFIRHRDAQWLDDALVSGALKFAEDTVATLSEGVDVGGDICKACSGKGTWDDAEIGDISYNTFTCKTCHGKGGSGLVGEIYHYLEKKSMGHNEVDAPNIANIVSTYSQSLSGKAELTDQRVKAADNLYREIRIYVDRIGKNNFPPALIEAGKAYFPFLQQARTKP